MTDYIQCHQCELMKTAANFFKDGRTKTGYRKICVKCTRHNVLLRKIEDNELTRCDTMAFGFILGYLFAFLLLFLFR